MTDAESATANLTVRGPGGLKMPIAITVGSTVLQLKEKIADTNKEFPAESGKVLKDEQTLESYGIQDGHMVHMVRSARPTATEQPSASAASTQGARALESQGVPSNLAADYAGPHMASLLNEAGGMFGNFGGMNPRDPNVMLGMMQNPEFLRHMRDMLGRPEVVDQIIASNPQMQAMGPQHFRDMITNPETMQRMTQLSQALGGLGGAPQWPPADANSLQQLLGGGPGAGLSGPGGLGVLGGLGGLGSLGGLGALGGLGGLGGQAADGSGAGGGGPPPEERYAAQLEQLHNMGFYDAQANLRALLLSGGSVEGAVGILLD